MGNINPLFSKVLAVLVWIVTLVGGLLDIYVSQFIIISIYARFFLGGVGRASAMDVAMTDALRISIVLVFAVCFVIFLVASTEYHFKHFGQPKSWRILGITVGVQLLIIAIAYIAGPVTW